MQASGCGEIRCPPNPSSMPRLKKPILIYNLPMKKLDDHTKALIAVLLAVVAGGGNAVFTKIALREIPPFSSIFLREKPKIDKDFGYAFAVSTFATINIVMFAFGVRLTSASVSQMIYAGVPMIIAILSYFMLKEKVTRQKVIGLIV